MRTSLEPEFLRRFFSPSHTSVASCPNPCFLSSLPEALPIACAPQPSLPLLRELDDLTLYNNEEREQQLPNAPSKEVGPSGWGMQSLGALTSPLHRMNGLWHRRSNRIHEGGAPDQSSSTCLATWVILRQTVVK
ncbi:uncharacterized protein BO96DRAFT_437151 [Aspergillus niger CBS 101883]|uniref:uncharacterized protein n=1 Tax=Aspergillus lacticoffeatus (strain CBS 101883) TaxID=1450533 RepID=UPI000D801223|nr:uncharacterized protein BO96DRAFT_437151 [Aspergillus niger CBS 101883]PYH53187.1 hypothetical protein BO96DRAFT_437151 [Aspergillus niger CBS 101883]